MDTSLDTYDQPKLNQEDINRIHRSVTSNEIETTRMSFPIVKSPGPDKCTAELY
jgi:hypothetical protein